MNATLKRSLSGVAFVVIVVGLIKSGSWGFMVLTLLINGLALYELYQIGEAHGYAPNKTAGIIAGSVGVFLVFDIAHTNLLSTWAILAVPAIFLAFLAELYRSKGEPLINTALTLAGWVYITLPSAFLTLIAFRDGGYQANLVLILFLLVWIYDTMAYVSGKTLGKHSLFYRISPNKTWEGTVGGVLFTVIAGALLFKFLMDQSFVMGIVTGLLVAIPGIFGDLLVSLFKRRVGWKDTGNILPGHGGTLDRFDAFLFCLPFAGTYLLVIG